jgi:hypothetical protein
LASQIAPTENNIENNNLSHYIQRAEDFVYSDFEWMDFVLTNKWTYKDIERCDFYNADKLSFSVKTKQFMQLLRKAIIGNVYKFKCKVEEVSEPDPNARHSKSRIITKNIVTPLVIAASDKAPWSVLPIKYGIIDYINHDKNILHILTQESKQVFCANNLSDATANMFVKFREYEEKHKDAIQTYVRCVSLCSRDEALTNMNHRIVVVDDVNENKQLFHIVLGPGLVSDIVRFDQTDIRPKVGDFLNVTYCIKKNKEGKKRIKILDVKLTDQTCENVTNIISGMLSVKYNYSSDSFDEPSYPDFAFIGDNYVHSKILRKYGITDNCRVKAKLVLGGDNKWKVYDLIMPN